MENRQEIKNSVKQRLIEFMAEQITREESFTELKNELIEELFLKKEIVAPVKEELEEAVIISPEQAQKDLKWMKEFGFSFNKEVVENRLKERAKELGLKDNAFAKRETMAEVLKNAREGRLPANLKGFSEDHSNEPDFGEMLIRLNNKIQLGKYDGSSFQDYALKYNYTESEKRAFKDNIIDFIKNNETKFWVETFNNNPNYYKRYKLTNSSLKLGASDNTSLGSAKNDFELNISLIYNDITKSYYIDRFDCRLNSLFMMNKDLGLIFGVYIVDMMAKLEREDSDKFSENVFKTKKPRKPRRKKKD